MAAKKPPVDPYVRKVIITRWVDGDTAELSIDLGFDVAYKTSLRLYGCNAPESRTKNADEKRRGVAAKALVNELAPPGSAVTVKSYKSGDEKYGRFLAEVFLVDGRSVGAELIKAGLALPWDGTGVRPI